MLRTQAAGRASVPQGGKSPGQGAPQSVLKLDGVIGMQAEPLISHTVNGRLGGSMPHSCRFAGRSHLDAGGVSGAQPQGGGSPVTGTAGCRLHHSLQLCDIPTACSAAPCEHCWTGGNTLGSMRKEAAAAQSGKCSQVLQGPQVAQGRGNNAA